MHAAGGGLPRRRRAGVGADAPLRRGVGVRRSLGGISPTIGSRRAVTVGDDAVLLVRGDDGTPARLLQRLPAPGPRAGAVRRDGPRPLDPVPVPRMALRARRHRCCRRPGSTRPDGFDKSEHGLVPVAVEEWHGWVMVNASGDAPPLSVFLGGIEARVADYEPERLVVGATHAYELDDQLEAHRRELPRVLPLPEHPSASCAASARRRAARTPSVTTGSGSAAGRT